MYLLSFKNVQTYAHGKNNRDVNQQELQDEKKNAIDILSNESKFEDKLEQKNHKRVWAALRDYQKNPYLVDKFKKELDSDLQHIWEVDFSKDQLQLPGDTWNKRFHEKVVEPIVENVVDDVNLTEDASESTRKIYEKYKSLKEERDEDVKFYPEQMDVSYEFAQRMCDEKNEEFCEKVCIFGNSGGENICDPDKDFCPLILVSLGKIVDCDNANEKCPVYKYDLANICKSAPNG